MGVLEMRAELLDGALPIPQRFRALFALRSVGGDAAVGALLEGLEDPSALFRHEVAFALGQMQAEGAVERLKQVLRDGEEHSMVRHEAAEALGAIASAECLEALEDAIGGEPGKCQVVRETAVLALQRLRHAQATRRGAQGAARGGADEVEATSTAAANPDAEKSAPTAHAPPPLGSAKEKLSAPATGAHGGGDALDAESPYISVDPVPAASSSIPTDQLRATLLDDAAEMWDRYGAMFALRNRGPAPEVAAVLGKVLTTSSSALLKHEVCYVLGQIQERGGGARDALRKTLEDAEEHPMVRHEAAEAIGSIAAQDTAPLLEKFRQDPDQIVAESCEVALDIMAAELSGEFVPLVVEQPAPIAV